MGQIAESVAFRALIVGDVPPCPATLMSPFENSSKRESGGGRGLGQ